MHAYIDKIFSLYGKNSADIELEFRIKYDFKSDINSIKKIINNQKKVNSKMIIEKTVNCIKNSGEGNLIYQVKFNEGGKKIIETYSKKKLGKPFFDSIDGVNIKMSISEEKNIPKFIAEDCDLIRIKNRLSIIMSKLKMWRLDITLVKTLSYTEDFNLSDLKSHIIQIFSKNIDKDSYVDFLETINYEQDNISIELELEYIGNKNHSKSLELTKDDYANIIKYISSMPIEKNRTDIIFSQSDNIKNQEHDINYHNNLYRNLLVRVANWIQPLNIHKYKSGELGIKKLTAQVSSLDIFQAQYTLLPNMDNYYISPKMDGIRTLLIFDNDKSEYFSINNEAKELNLLDFGCDNKFKKGGFDNPNETILDTEFYTDPNTLESSYHLFDVIVYKGEPIFNKDYIDRIKYIDKVLNDFVGCKKLIKKYAVDLSKSWKTELSKILKKKWKFETDGWIFTPSCTVNKIKADYIKGKVWKWKPVNLLSIDFLSIRKNSQSFSLYSGMNKNIAEKILPSGVWNNKFPKYGPILFTPTYLPFYQTNSIDTSLINEVSLINNEVSLINNNKMDNNKMDNGEMDNNKMDNNKMDNGEMDNKIIELIWKKNSWKILRIRDDRQIEVERGNYFGNNHRVAELNWHSIFWPIELDLFLKNPSPENESFSIVNNNSIYFYKLYSFLLKKILHKDRDFHLVEDFHLVDAGIIYPFFNYITIFGIKYIDFVVSDGFSCLNIIKRKYDKKFISGSEKNIIIRAFKPNDYNISVEKENITRAYIAILPTKDQILHIKKTIEINKKIEMYFVFLSKQKDLFDNFSTKKLASVKKLTSVFKNYNSSSDSSISDLDDLYLLHIV